MIRLDEIESEFGTITLDNITAVTRIDWRGVFDWRLAVAFALFVIVLFGHLWIFKASPFPSGWRPY